MTASLSRRGALPMAAPAAPEPIVALLNRAMALRAESIDPTTSEDQSDASYDEMAALWQQAAATPVTTMAGALAALTWARTEFHTCYIDIREPDHLDELTLIFLDAALGVVRQAVEGGARG